MKKKTLFEMLKMHKKLNMMKKASHLLMIYQENGTAIFSGKCYESLKYEAKRA